MTKTKRIRGAGHSMGLDRAKVIKKWESLDGNIAATARHFDCASSTIRYHLEAEGLVAPPATKAKPKKTRKGR